MQAYRQPAPGEVDSRVRNTLHTFTLVAAFVGNSDGELNVRPKLDSRSPTPVTLPCPGSQKFICRLAAAAFASTVSVLRV